MFQHIKRRFYSIFKKGLKDERGAIALIFGIVLVLGFGVADTIAQKAKVADLSIKLQRIADEASGVALRKYSVTGDIKAATKAANDYIEQQRARLDSEGSGMLRSYGGASLTIEEVAITPKPRPEARVHLISQYPGLLFLIFDKTHYLESTGVSTTADVNTEIAVVLDISESMTKQARMYRAKMALIEFAGRTFKTLKSKNNKVAFSLIPYAGSVHLGEDYWYFGGWHPNSFNRATPRTWNGCYNYWSPSSRGWTDNIKTDYPGKPIVHNVHRHSVFIIRMDNVETNARYPVCPDGHNKILAFAQTAGQFSIALSDLGYGDGTSTDTGVAWGFRLLSGNWKGRFRGAGSETFPLEYTDKNKKHMILLTDGKIHVPHSGYTNQQAVRNFRNTCARIGQRGIIVHVIGYDTGPQAREQLQRCANIEYGANSGSQFYEATSSTIDTVFDEILAQVTPIKTGQ